VKIGFFTPSGGKKKKCKPPKGKSKLSLYPRRATTRYQGAQTKAGRRPFGREGGRGIREWKGISPREKAETQAGKDWGKKETHL